MSCILYSSFPEVCAEIDVTLTFDSILKTWGKFIHFVNIFQKHSKVNISLAVQANVVNSHRNLNSQKLGFKFCASSMMGIFGTKARLAK